MVAFLRIFSVFSYCLLAACLRHIQTTQLGLDPPTINRLNGESFQQDALATFNGYQYAVLWEVSERNMSIRHVVVARRVVGGEFEKLVLDDYGQVEDDGHDVISLGISRTDGSLHLIFDQHDNDLRYRSSTLGVATNPTETIWAADVVFTSSILNFLPGLSSIEKSTHFSNVTYPRFLDIPRQAQKLIPAIGTVGTPDLLLELRVGRSGLGDDWLYHYYPADIETNQSGRWVEVGKYLLGVNNNPYINGLDFDLQGNLHTTWTYRDFINDTGKDVAVQAGPNGPENNHDLNYAYSPDGGYTWKNTWGQDVANVPATANLSAGSSKLGRIGAVPSGTPIAPTSPGIVVFGIPKFGGILNQEAQTVDSAGRVHVLNRENGTGVEQWFHYWRTPTSDKSTSGYWIRTSLPLSIPGDPNNITGIVGVIGKRGKLISVSGSSTHQNTSAPSESSSGPGNDHGDSDDILFAILPSNAPSPNNATTQSSALTILQSTSKGQFEDWAVAWTSAGGCGWEPLADRYRISEGVLSLYLVNSDESTGKETGVVEVVDLQVV
ncbi:hypothetical protein PC9H_002437 [Pleurotus ostreatus]|uniref:Uncharacterized protein n=1 Tax=Pleurotus ostreatus TaxID=5322 RepID=A0A8H7DM79_PLEOS|nr:uncharacterized protein PC9H_002437 [Pleurotus ostreatus]KAF7416174.1 hypothetical protein PC9H_002437 [Pleurotus ostreatus]KAJ8689011.1 hypothetical protein PTI98_013077 [Pleurotus ostreatus]